MESLFQSYPSVGSDDRMRAVVIHHQLVIDIQHTAIVRRRTKSINPVFRHINQPREDISEMVFPFGICNGSFAMTPCSNNGVFSISSTVR